MKIDRWSVDGAEAASLGLTNAYVLGYFREACEQAGGPTEVPATELAAAAGLSLRTVHRATKALRDAGALTGEGVEGYAMTWTVTR